MIEPIRQLILRRKVVDTLRFTKSLVTWGARCRKAARRDLLGACFVRDTSTNQSRTSGSEEGLAPQRASLLDLIFITGRRFENAVLNVTENRDILKQ